MGRGWTTAAPSARAGAGSLDREQKLWGPLLSYPPEVRLDVRGEVGRGPERFHECRDQRLGPSDGAADQVGRAP